MTTPYRFSLLPTLLAAVAALGAGAALAQPLPTAQPESVGMSSERLDKLTTVFQKEITDKMTSILGRAFHQILARTIRDKISMRTAATAIGVKRVRLAKQQRGLFP